MINKHCISFTSKIKIVSGEDFRNKSAQYGIKKYQTVKSPWLIDDTIVSDQGMTEGITSCNAGGVTNSEELMMFHLHPAKALHNWRLTACTLQDFINYLKEFKQPLQGLIVGGEARIPDSVEAFARIAVIFNNNDVKTSVLWGQNAGSTDIIYSLEDDTWFVSSKKCRIKNGFDEVLTLENFKSNYQFIYIAPQDQLFINDKPVDIKKSKINTTKKELMLYQQTQVASFFASIKQQAVEIFKKLTIKDLCIT